MRLIDADLIMDCLLNEGQNNGEKYGIHWGDKIKFTPSEVAKIVARTVPTVDAVPVIRCKDCIHCSKENCWTENGIVTLNNCWNDQGIFTYVLDNDYCSRGYRRDNKEDSEE